jgi:hypothetical protein
MICGNFVPLSQKSQSSLQDCLVNAEYCENHVKQMSAAGWQNSEFLDVEVGSTCMYIPLLLLERLMADTLFQMQLSKKQTHLQSQFA